MESRSADFFLKKRKQTKSLPEPFIARQVEEGAHFCCVCYCVAIFLLVVIYRWWNNYGQSLF